MGDITAQKFHTLLQERLALFDSISESQEGMFKSIGMPNVKPIALERLE